MKRAVIVAAWAGLAACAYKPGSFSYEQKPFLGSKTTVGCLDLAIDRRPDMGKSAVLEYRFGNRCNKPATVDLAFVRVVGRTIDGQEHRLAPYDPEGQLMALKVDGRYSGGEALAYPSELALVQVCVDVASLVQQQPERWMCFGRVDQSGDPYQGIEIVSEVTP